MTKPNDNERFRAGKEVARLSAQIKSTLAEVTRDFKAGELVDHARIQDVSRRLNDMQSIILQHNQILQRERRMVVVKKEN